jgi:hypothetical protein
MSALSVNPLSTAQPNSELRPDPLLDPRATAEYDAEVAGLNHEPQQYPTQTRHSQLARCLLRLIEDVVYKDMSYEEAMPGYNAEGGRAGASSVKTPDDKKGISAISRAFHNNAPTWYQEQKVVMPWIVRNIKQRKALTKLGLGKNNFKVVHPRAGRQSLGQNPPNCMRGWKID